MISSISLQSQRPCLTEWLSEPSLMVMAKITKALVHCCKDSHGRSVFRIPVQEWKIFWSQPSKGLKLVASRLAFGKAAQLIEEGDTAERIGIHGCAYRFQYLNRAVKFLENLAAQCFRW